jgi:hypothetical protein
VKIRGHVLEVKTLGDKLEVRMQGEGTGDAAWRPMNVITFQCADLPSSQRAFYVGRQVTVEIKAGKP